MSGPTTTGRGFLQQPDNHKELKEFDVMSDDKKLRKRRKGK